jgi:hypothetical protein
VPFGTSSVLDVAGGKVLIDGVCLHSVLLGLDRKGFVFSGICDA